MGANLFGERFQFTSFGESHGAGLGLVIDGCPANVPFDMNLLIQELARRRPGPKQASNQTSSVSLVSDRQEEDFPEVLSGVFEEKTLGTPIAILVRNKDARSQDYSEIKKEPRKGHADDTWKNKFLHTDHRGGGRSSGRETLARVMAGAVAQMVLKHLHPELSIFGFTTQVGSLKLEENEIFQIEKTIQTSQEVDVFSSRCPQQVLNFKIEELLMKAKKEGKSYGGQAALVIKNPPAGLGQPVFHKLKSDLAKAFMSIGATSGVELGMAHEAVEAEGSEFHSSSSQRKYGGIRGGISTGEDILFRIHFKPTASVLDTAKKGRHDPCIILRAIPVVEAMAWVTLLDHVLWKRQDLP